MRTPFKMKAGKEGPMKKNFGIPPVEEAAQKEINEMIPAQVPLAVVPDQEEYNNSIDQEKKEFDKVAKAAGLPRN